MNTYSTTDLALATWLYMNGKNPLKVFRGNNHNVTFVFEIPAQDNLITIWEIGSAEGNLLRYFNCYQGILKKVHQAKAGNVT